MNSTGFRVQVRRGLGAAAFVGEHDADGTEVRAWLADADAIGTTGLRNALADDRSAPCGATTCNTSLVEVVAAG